MQYPTLGQIFHVLKQGNIQYLEITWNKGTMNYLNQTWVIMEDWKGKENLPVKQLIIGTSGNLEIVLD